MIRGILRYADSTRRSGNQIKVVDRESKIHVVQVPANTVNRIVQQLWNEPVVIQGIRTGNRIVLETIAPSDSS